MIKLTHILFSHPSIHYIIKEYKLNYGDYELNEMESCRNLKRSTNTKLGYSLKRKYQRHKNCTFIGAHPVRYAVRQASSVKCA